MRNRNLKVLFVSDFFVEHVSGGAEKFDNALFKHMQKIGICSRILSKNANVDVINLYGKLGYFFVISNFIGLSSASKKVLQNYKYIIIEHDHKYLKNRDPSPFKDYRAPHSEIINVDFYKNAKKIYAQSTLHAKVIGHNLSLDNIEALGCSVWSDEELDILSDMCNSEKREKAYVIDYINPAKGKEEAINVCNEKGLEYSLERVSDYKSFINLLSQHSYFVFMPRVFETFSRVVMEAKMLKCKVLTNKRSTCVYEPYFKNYSGKELIEVIRKLSKEILEKITNTATEEKETTSYKLNYLYEVDCD